MNANATATTPNVTISAEGVVNVYHYLMRLTFPTNVNEGDPGNWPAFSDPFPIPEGSQVIAADWSVQGEVTITYLVRKR